MSQLNPSLSNLSIKPIAAPPLSAAANHGVVATMSRNLRRALRSLIGRKAYKCSGKSSRVAAKRDGTARSWRNFASDAGSTSDSAATRSRRAQSGWILLPYTSVGRSPVQLGGDCRNLRWLRDGVLDYVYSSHVLEDFPESETPPAIAALEKNGSVRFITRDDLTRLGMFTTRPEHYRRGPFELGRGE